MASDESMVINSSSVLDEEYDDTDDGFHYQTRQSSLSRLSICTSSFHDDDDEDNFTSQPSELRNFMSEMSLENFDDMGAEADGEISDGDDSDSDKETSGFYSLPTIMSRRRRKVNVSAGLEKDNEVMNIDTLAKQRRYGHGFNFNGEERYMDGDGNCYVGGGGEGELTVLTKVKGGKKSMKMGFEEVKACRDLGFDLEVSGRVSVSNGSNRETQNSSGSNSPISNWRISSPGDDPRDVKARLKMWAQAVALASTSR
ncbi:Fold protein [Hirschfeldia incana]|nr:Fold protein [Hirschfeldia incana]